MKKYLLFVLVIILTKVSVAQYCGGAGPTVCTTDNTLTGPGISDYHTFPCVRNNAYYSQVIQVFFPDTVNQFGFTVNVDSIIIDSITNLPCGLCWSCDNSSFTYAGGSKACIRISGTPNDLTGAYQINMYGTAITTLGPYSGSLENLGFQFFLNVVAQNDSCSTINILNLNSACSLNHPSQVACNFPVQLGASPAVTNCHFDSTILSVIQPAGSGYQFYWFGFPDTFTTFPPPYLNDSGSSLKVVGSNEILTLTIVDTVTGCSSQPSLDFSANSGFYHVPSVCYATCDSGQSNSNGVTFVFQKDDWFNNIASYTLYRQDSAGQYNLLTIGQVSGSSLGKITDTFPRPPANYAIINGQPVYMDYYTLTATTNCGDVGQNGNGFTPSELRVDTLTNGLPQLIWTNSIPLTYSGVYIFSRYPGANWRVRFSSITLSDTTWIDQAPDSTQMQYMLGYVLTVNCDPSRTATMSFSNFASATIGASHVVHDTVPVINSAQSLSRSEDVLLYPNPAGEQLFVQLAGVNGINAINYKMYNALGQLINSGPLNVLQRNQLYIGNLAPGIYTLSVQADKQAAAIRMFVKQ